MEFFRGIFGLFNVAYKVYNQEKKTVNFFSTW